MIDPEFLKVFEGVKLTFSRWCISGIVSDCRCSRCLRKQGLPVTDETERAAEERSGIETKAFRERCLGKLEAHDA